ncbi:cytochrome P450 [Spinellus fusiger]|nr:cytochrome P450 [Spinellus fusiger]
MDFNTLILSKGEQWEKLLSVTEAYVNNTVLKPLGISASIRQMAIGLGIASSVGYIISEYIINRLYLHPVNRVPGPHVGWFPFSGNMIEIIREESGIPHARWAKKYGGIVGYHGPWNTPRYLVTDPDILKHVLTTHEPDYIKSPQTAAFIRRILGNGLLVAEGEAHRMQRKMMNPAFNIGYIRHMVPLIAIPGIHLRNRWLEALEGKESMETNVSHELSLATLDVIGVAGFGEEFEATRMADTPQSNKLGDAYLELFSFDLSLARSLSLFFPLLRHVPTEVKKKTDRNLVVLNSESKALVERCIDRNNQSGSKERDILSVMVKEANKNGFELSVRNLQDQCLTFLAAGHETTSVSLSWCLWLLAIHPEIQTALREEVKPLLKDMDMHHPMFSSADKSRDFAETNEANVPSYDAINSLNLLNNVCKEVMRLIPPVPTTSRISTKDSVLGGHFVPKGSGIFVSIYSLHRSKAIWGEDVEEFRPSRWNEEPANRVTPYEYMPFLAGGRQCIGYRFALIEMKLLLAIIINTFEFSETPNFKITKKQSLTLRPNPYMSLIIQKVK